MAKIEAPNKGYNGPGPGGAVFKDGVAQVDDEAAINYYRSAGYSVSGSTDNPVEPAPEPPDPRDLEDEVQGTRLRDAAVNPEPEDFLAPINAGQANPHGSTVIAPEIHASGPKGIRPGVVAVDDHGKQEEREKEFADLRLSQRKTAAEANQTVISDMDARGPLGISDPGSAEVGEAEAEESSSEAAPAKSDNKAAWVDYAVSQGADRDEAEGLTKAELQDRYA